MAEPADGRGKRLMSGDNFELQAWDRLEDIPDSLESRELIGHRDQINRLAKAFADGHIHHAWLVTGPRGIGKATMAARFAGHVLRYGNSDNIPAQYVLPGESDGVERKVARSAHPNLLCLRRAWNERERKWRSELTVEEVRRSIRFFASARAEPGWRVVIIDTADDMNLHAANALLKILEEPPEKTLFFILAHSGRNVLATMRSRCQTLTLKPLEDHEIVEALDKLGVLEGVSEPDRALTGQLAAGSVRRAIVILRADGLVLYRRFLALVASSGGPDWTAIHALAGELSPIARNDRYRLMMDFAHDLVSRRLRGEPDPAASGAAAVPADISALAGWVEVWEKVRRSADRTDAYNLDRKQVILNLFSALHGVA